jgi:hypothetical protein
LIENGKNNYNIKKKNAFVFSSLKKQFKKILYSKLIGFIKKYTKKPLSPNGERGLGREVKQSISF